MSSDDINELARQIAQNHAQFELQQQEKRRREVEERRRRAQQRLAVEKLCEEFVQWARTNRIKTDWRHGRTTGWKVGSVIESPNDDNSRYDYYIVTTQGRRFTLTRHGPQNGFDESDGLATLEARLRRGIAQYVFRSGIPWCGS